MKLITFIIKRWISTNSFQQRILPTDLAVEVLTAFLWTFYLFYHQHPPFLFLVLWKVKTRSGSDVIFIISLHIPRFFVSLFLSKSIFTQASCHYSKYWRMLGIHFTGRFHCYAVHLSQLKPQKSIPCKRYFVTNNFFTVNVINILRNKQLYVPLSYRHTRTYYTKSNRQLL